MYRESLFINPVSQDLALLQVYRQAGMIDRQGIRIRSTVPEQPRVGVLLIDRGAVWCLIGARVSKKIPPSTAFWPASVVTQNGISSKSSS